MPIEALCVEGGETSLEPGPWVGGLYEYIDTVGPEGMPVIQGVCINPSVCIVARHCTGKVFFSSKEDTGFSKALVQEVRFEPGFNPNNFF
jgi:hypothetical protein